VFCHQVKIDLDKKDDIIYVRPLGDIHFGNLGCDMNKIQDSINWVGSHKDNYTIGMGDYIDNVMAWAQGGVDKRWNPETVDRKMLTTEEQTDVFIKLFGPIKEKIWGLLAGNHEWKTINQARFIKDFCKPLGLEYLGRLAFLNVQISYNKKILKDFLFCVMHGGYAGMMAGGAVNRMKMISGDFAAGLGYTFYAKETKMSWNNSLPLEVTYNWGKIIQTALTSFILAIIASLYPSYRATKLLPMEAIRTV